MVNGFVTRPSKTPKRASKAPLCTADARLSQALEKQFLTLAL